MIDKKYFTFIKQRYSLTTATRRQLITLSSEAQHLAKQAIFSIQRDDLNKATQLIRESKKLVNQGAKLCQKIDELEFQGSYRQALEELIEAVLFYNLSTVSKIGKVEGFKVPLEVYLGGLADFVGELARRAVILATRKEEQQVKQLAKVASEVVAELSQMNLVGYLRNKADQAKGALRRLEDILYDLSVKAK
ncbi:MAG: hypothetical protein V1712_01980 [Patescibacteria group bacterium]